MTNIEKTLKTIFDEDESIPEQYTDAYWRVTSPTQIAKLGITKDEAAQVAKEVRRLADVEIEKRAANYLKEARQDYDDEWARLQAFSPMYGGEISLSEEDENEGWWTDAVKDKIIDGVCADWDAVKENPKFVFERSLDHGYDLTVMTLEQYCDSFKLNRSDELVESILDMDSKEDALAQIDQFENDGEIDAETAADMRKEVNR